MNDERETFTRPSADREPTDAEQRAAERVAEQVHLDEVAEHYEEMAERGTHQKGEGEISP